MVVGTALHKVRVMLDSGSSITLVRRSLVQYHGLVGKNCSLQLFVVGGESTTTREVEVEITLMSLDGRCTLPPFVAVTRKDVVAPLPAVRLDTQHYEHLKDVQFTEEYPQEEDMIIDILVDVDLYLEIVKGEVVKSSRPNEPKVVPTLLGNVLGGAYVPIGGKSAARRQLPAIPTAAAVIRDEDTLVTDFKAFMSLEDVGCCEKDGKMSVEDEEAVRLMKEKTHYDKEKKQYVTGLLWKHPPEEMLDSNYMPAKHITLSAKRKSVLHKKEEMVNAAYKEQIDLGFAEEVPKDEIKVSHPVYYIPTRPVYKPGSETTKCRIVMNASSKCKTTGKSLNDCLYQGPTLLPDLVHLLLGFRLHRYVTVCDISRMFWQIRINPPDADCLRFLWQWAETDPVSLYRALSVTFGVLSAPFQAIWTVLFHCDSFHDAFPLGAEAVKKTLYMDDASALNSTKEEAIETVKQIYGLFMEASMQPHKWTSNSKEILTEAKIPEQYWAKKEVHKVLGVQWDTANDNIAFDFSQIVDTDGAKQTKRLLIQQAARIFDPLGLIAPFTLKAKLLFQQCWREEIDWDSELTQEIASEWDEWRQQVSSLGRLSQPRVVALKDKEAWLACFADASAFAYGACIYLVQDGKARLLISKTRVAPMKTPEKAEVKITIARLELLASMIATRLADYVKGALGEGFISHTRYFTDSLITLWRIRNGPSGYKVWVANRVSEIRRRSSDQDWHFVPGMLNPADLASRSATVEELLTNELWWEGPAFLGRPQEDWPSHKALSRQEAFDQNELDKAEQRPQQTAAAVSAALAAAAAFRIGAGLREIFVNTSTWAKIIRKTVRLLKFIVHIMPSSAKIVLSLRVFKETAASAMITVAEIRAAEMLWILWAQRDAWAEEMTVTSDNLVRVKKGSDLTRFSVVIDNSGVLRSETRLSLSETLPDETVTPILLPKRSEIVEKYVLHLHTVYGHIKGGQMLYILRRQFRLVGGKNELKRILHMCMTRGCTAPISLEQRLAPLPPERIDFLVAWGNIAVDFFGPIQIKHQCELRAECAHKDVDKKHKCNLTAKCPHEEEDKAWGCVFTCLQTRAVHLELVEGLSTATFLQAFNRMVSRRGHPQFVWSDNAKTFKSASRILHRLYKKVDWTEVHNTSAKKGIQWKFGVEKAPHTNGIVERMVRSVKDALKSTLAAPNLSARHLETIMIEVEGIINDRPLIAPSESDDEPATISPAMLCIGRPIHLIPMANSAGKPGSDFNRMQLHRRELVNKFWRRWQKDYLLQHQATKFVGAREAVLEKGQIVLLREENLNKGKWKLARVVEPILGRDGRIRRVKLRTQQGYIDRHINHLALLEGTPRLQNQRHVNVAMFCRR